MRLLLLIEAAVFLLAASAHLGWTVTGYEHMRAATAESVIAAVLLLGFILSVAIPDRIRAIGMTAQIFALLGTVIGVVMVAIGVGPQTGPDMIYHALMLILLCTGIWIYTAKR
ncbi:MAG TPA: hypothetical protein VH858_02880 [Hyphomicrobiales bacterium]|jgi:hypothetical protein